jgi:hypothetical protein
MLAIKVFFVITLQGMLDGLPVDLKESGLAEEAGMIVLRERHKGNTWKAADAIINSLFKVMDAEGKGYISKPEFKGFFLHRLHPELERHSQSHAIASRAPHTIRTRSHGRSGQTWDFNRVLQGARMKYQERQARNRRGGGGGGGGCFIAGTEVLTPSGTQAIINQLKLGDSVMAFDSEGTLQPSTVRGCMSFLSDKHYVVTLSNGSVMRVTGQHPICVGPNAFCRVDTLSVGHRVMVNAANDTSLQNAVVASLEAVSDNTVVYNLSTTPHHTFFAADVAVHNKGGGGGCFSGDVLVTVIENSSDRRCACMRQLKPGDVIEGRWHMWSEVARLRCSPVEQVVAAFLRLCRFFDHQLHHCTAIEVCRLVFDIHFVVCCLL